jgi:hypothetical protein
MDFINQADTLTNFRILLPKNRSKNESSGAVLQYIDKKGEAQQYSKSISGGALDFLYK